MYRQALRAPIALLLIASSSGALAEEECRSTSIPPAGVMCADPDADQIDYNCPVVWEQIEDCRLNVAFKKLVATLESEPQQLAKLRVAQRAWIRFRDADVELVSAHYGEGGSLGRSIAAMQRFRLTRERLREIERRLADSGRW